ncbi:mechanosensitive ion channel family protein [Saccharicrinis sp. FJH62]|uniref:mechanosensitive ion channel family protein n=1 Tax=Saccharicrinis sp. FJH62 TaxID=3344657 RepID=UPI0035D50A68
MDIEFYQKLSDTILSWFTNHGFAQSTAETLRTISIFAVIIILSIAVDFVFRKIIIAIVARIIKKTKNKYDDIFLERKVFSKLAHIAPVLVVYFLLPTAFPDSNLFLSFLEDICFVFIAFNILFVLIAFMDALHDIYNQFPISQNRSIKGYVQLFKIIFYIFTFLAIISIIFNINMTKIFTGIGALAAVLILVFKDTILGLVASVQLSGNDMVKPGDWISMPKFNADGDVIEINLTTVKVQNWDKTISTIPTYALVSDSFQNWRGMSESGGRRIKRSINIDMSSVMFAPPEMLKKFKTFHMLKDYVNKKEIEIEEYNKKLKIGENEVYNGRRMTNLGIFRKYLENYLKQHPKIHQDMTFLVRQLQPTDKGIPLEIYVFSNDQAWANYEAIQADIFDHVLAIIPEFGLRVFQAPTGSDFKNLRV